MVWDKERIKSVLPQREPFLFIDEVIETEGTKRVVAVKHVKIDEYYFKGHFPGNPIMPGVLLVEAMAQASIILYSLCQPKTAETHPTYYLGRTQAEFINPVKPNDKLIIEALNLKIISTSGITDNTVKVNGEIVAKARIVFGVKANG